MTIAKRQRLWHLSRRKDGAQPYSTIVDMTNQHQHTGMTNRLVQHLQYVSKGEMPRWEQSNGHGKRTRGQAEKHTSSFVESVSKNCSKSFGYFEEQKASILATGRSDDHRFQRKNQGHMALFKGDKLVQHLFGHVRASPSAVVSPKPKPLARRCLTARKLFDCDFMCAGTVPCTGRWKL